MSARRFAFLGGPSRWTSLVASQKRFEMTHENQSASSYLSGRNPFCGDKELDSARRNTQHRRCLMNAYGELLLFSHARTLRFATRKCG